MCDIGTRIKTIRLSRELSIRKAATIVQMSHSYWNSVENGDKNPTLSTLKRIAEALDVRLIDLIEPEEETKFGWFYELPPSTQDWLKNPKARESMKIGAFIHRHGLDDTALKAILLAACQWKYFYWAGELPKGSHFNPKLISALGDIESLFGQAQEQEDFIIKTESENLDD